jgi:anti-sigma B factor antagonist
MQISTREVGVVLVVDLVGRFDTQRSGGASEELARILDGSSGKVVLNLDAVEFLSSAGLRIILRAARTLRAGDGEIKLCNARGVVAEVLEVSDFGNLLHVCDSERAALDAF